MDELDYSPGVFGLSDEIDDVMIEPMTSGRLFTASAKFRQDSDGNTASIIYPLRNALENGRDEVTIILTVLVVDSLTEEGDDMTELEVARETIDVSDGTRGNHLGDYIDYGSPKNIDPDVVEASINVTADEG